jgi:hypothetical protein
MAQPKLSKLEMQIMDALWSKGALSIREIQELFPERRRPAYTTIQTTVYRMEARRASSGWRSASVAPACRSCRTTSTACAK